MKILLIDIREERASKLQGILAAGNRHQVVHTHHINGPGGGFATNNEWDDTKKQACAAYLRSENPDLVLLHVSNDQVYSTECLTQVCQDRIVVCFTGGKIPDPVQADCADNHKHCYFPGAFATEYTTEDDWRRSAEVSALMKLFDALEPYLQEYQATPEKALETLKKAKNAFQHFNQYLEDTLKDLTDKLRVLLAQDPRPTAEQFKSLAEERDEAFKYMDA